jgi:hypothetical protein
MPTFATVRSSLLQDEFEDTKRVIRIHKSKKDRQHNGQKTEGQTTQWPKDRRTEGQTTQWPKDRRTDNTANLGAPEG